jgi:uncharacterized membrane protein
MTSTQHLVLAFFEDEKAADRAVEALQAWDETSESIKYGAIGVLVKGPDGKLKQHRFGPREARKGMGIGVVLGVVAAVLPGVGLLAGLATGAVLGAAGGALTHEGLGLSQEDLQRYSAEMDAGHAAVGVMADEAETQATMDFLASWGGRAETHELTGEAADAA